MKFSHMGLEFILWKSRVKINFFLVLRFPFLSGRSVFPPDEQLTTFLFFASIDNGHLSCSSHQHEGIQLSAVCYMWKEYFLFMLVWSNFSKARRFCLRISNPLKVLYNYLHD